MDRIADFLPQCAICSRSSATLWSTTCQEGHGVNICEVCRRATPSCPICAYGTRRSQHTFGGYRIGNALPPLGQAMDSTTGLSRAHCDLCGIATPGTGSSQCLHVTCERCRRPQSGSGNVPSCPVCRRSDPIGDGVVGAGRAIVSRSSMDLVCRQCHEPCPSTVFGCDRCSAITCSRRCSAAHFESSHGSRYTVVCCGGGNGGRSSTPPELLSQLSSSSSSSSVESDRQQRLREQVIAISSQLNNPNLFGVLQLQDGGTGNAASTFHQQRSIALGRFDAPGTDRYSIVGDGSALEGDAYGRLSAVDRVAFERSLNLPSSSTSAAMSTSNTSSLSDDLERRLRNITLSSDLMQAVASANSMNQLGTSLRSELSPSANATGLSIDFGNLVVPPPGPLSGKHLSGTSAPVQLQSSCSSPGIPRYAQNTPVDVAATTYQLFQQHLASTSPLPSLVVDPRQSLDVVSTGGTNLALHIDVLRDRLNQMVNGFNLERQRASPQHSVYDVIGSDGSEKSATCIVRGFTTGVAIQLNNMYGAPVDDDAELDVALIVASRGGLVRLNAIRRPEVGRRLFDFTPTSDGLHFVNATIRGRPINQSPQRFLVVGNYPLSYSFQPPMASLSDDNDLPTNNVPHSAPTDERSSMLGATWNLQETRRLSGGLSAALMKPWGVCVDPSGTQLLVADRDAHRIVVFDLSTGSVVLTWGQHGPSPGQFHRPTHVAFDSVGRVVVTDKDNHRVQVFADHVSWRLDSVIGGSGHAVGLFRFPWEVAVNRSDDVLVSDSKNFRVQLFSRRASGGYRVIGVYAFDSQTSTGRGSDECKDKDGPRGVAFDPFGFAIIADYDRHRVLVLSHDLRSLVHVIGHLGWSAVGQIDRPRGLAIDPGVGSIYLVVSRGNRRVNHVVKMCPKTGRCLAYPLAADMCGICRLPGGRVAVVTLGTGSSPSGVNKNGIVFLQETAVGLF